MKEAYYVKELQNVYSVKVETDFIVMASSLTSAKIQATKSQMFYGTALKIYYDKDCKYLAAAKIDDKWRNVQDEEES